MILADTSVWADHLRDSDPEMLERLNTDAIVIHSHVLGEIALGSLKNRVEIMAKLHTLPRSPLAEDLGVVMMIEARKLFSRGIGFTDAHLVAACLIDRRLRLWTRDRRLNKVATELGLSYRPEQ